MRAFIDDINRRGGLNGHRIVPVLATNSAADDNVQGSQAACESWTKDHNVFIALPKGINSDGDRDVFENCMRRSGGVVVTSALTRSDESTYRAHPNIVEISTLSLDRQVTAMARGLSAADFFGNRAKVGIVTWDDSTYRNAVTKRMVPALAAAGIKSPTVTYVSPPQSSSDFGATSAQASNAAVQLSIRGIDHVIVVDGPSGVAASGAISSQFMTAAESHGYRPRYGLGSGAGPNVLVANVPAAQLDEAVAVGWLPTYDVGGANNPLRTSPSSRHCNAVVRAAGVQTTTSDASRVAMACDLMTFLERVFSTLHGDVTAGAFLAAVDRVGTRHDSPLTFRTRFSDGRRDGAAAVRTAAFSSDCNCFKYVTGDQPVA